MKACLAYTLIFSSFCLSLVAASASDSARKVDTSRKSDTARKSEMGRGEGAKEVVARDDYVLQPLDLLRVLVFQEEDINKQGEVRISEQATVTLPMIGTVNLRGKTVRQAEALIRDLYDKDYLVNPQVNVQVVKYAERFVNVSGAVNNAGRVPFPQERGLTVFAAITAAGGYSRLANLKKVTITRKGADGAPEKREINVEAIIKGEADDVPLENDDTIVVPERII
jgi:polysaccharide export outer membrane protein